VIRFTNNQILYNLDSVIKKIQGEIGKRTPLQGVPIAIGRGAKSRMNKFALGGRGRKICKKADFSPLWGELKGGSSHIDTVWYGSEPKMP
jgi:hypothetical protein